MTRIIVTSCFVGALLTSIGPKGALGQTVKIISVDSNGNSGDNDCGTTGGVSDDGRYVAFESLAGNLVPGDTNSVSDCFLWDNQAQTLIRVDLGPNGVQADYGVGWTAISRNGSTVAFSSRATTLVKGVKNSLEKIFVYDISTGNLVVSSRDSNGNLANADCTRPHLSYDGRWVGFFSGADNLVPGDTNKEYDSFIRDRVLKTTIRVSLDSNGSEGNGGSYSPYVTPDGRWATFQSNASNLVASDTNSSDDIFLRDMLNGTTTRVSVDANGNEADGGSGFPPESRMSISYDGRFIAFESSADNLVSNDTNGQVDVFVKDVITGAVIRANLDNSGSQGTSTDIHESRNSSISADGRFVAFESPDTNLVPNDTNGVVDIFVRDTFLNTTTLLSQSDAGVLSDDASRSPYISSNGDYVEFVSWAKDLVSPAPSCCAQTYVTDRQTVFGYTEWLGGGSVGGNGQPASFYFQYPVLGAQVTISGGNLDANRAGVIFVSTPSSNPYSPWPGCTLYLDFTSCWQVAVLQSDSNGNWSLSAQMPSDSSLIGTVLTLQGIFATSSGGKPALTNAVNALIGN